MGLEVFERGGLPRWLKVRQRLHATQVEDVAAAVAAEFQRPEIQAAIVPGAQVALAVGSRGIDRIDQVVREAVLQVRYLGAHPFIIPAMGSHGGATASGQAEVLAHYGITEAAMGCPIRSSIEAVQLGRAENGVPVWFDKLAYAADVVIPINRVKPHTDFHAPIESGLVKMIAIGLGKQKGADIFHRLGFAEFHHLLPAVARYSLNQVHIPFGLALVENGYARLSHVEVVLAERIWDREPELLRIAREQMPRLPGERIDVLIVDEIGKDISGIGADTNVVNRYYDGPLPFKPRIQRLVFRDLTPETEGNASGIGLADVVLRQAVCKLDPVKTYMNCATAKTPEGARVPLTVDNDRQALFVALACCLQTQNETAHITRIRDTKHLEELWVSEPMLPELHATGHIDEISAPEEICFDAHGMFVYPRAA